MQSNTKESLWSDIEKDQSRRPLSPVASDAARPTDGELSGEDITRKTPPTPPGTDTPGCEHIQPTERPAPSASGSVGLTTTPAAPSGSMAGKAPLEPGNALAPLGHRFALVRDQSGNAYIVEKGAGNPVLYRIGTAETDGLLRRMLRQKGERATARQIKDLNEELRAEAELTGTEADVWRRVGRSLDGELVVALYDDANTQVVIGPSGVQVVREGSRTLFHRAPSAMPMQVPAPNGDIKRLHRYLNLDALAFTLYRAWLSYTLAHPKAVGTKYPILVFLGGQGTGKSHASAITVRLLDPNRVGVELLPTNVKDIAVAAQSGHVVAYDNMRHLSAAQSDTLCITSTGGSKTARKLYTDDDQKVITLHAAVILNGITSFVEYPDLAQRCLVLRLEPLSENARRSDAQMQAELERDLPVIMRGLFDSVAKILSVLPDVQVTNPQRMIDFVRWLAAMEVVDGARPGTYQDVYAEALDDGQLESLLDNPVGAAILDMVEELGDDVYSGEGEWTGTPAELLARLNARRGADWRRTPRDWPDNEIALSKRLIPLQPALATQGIDVTFRRGRRREITIRRRPGSA